MDNKFKLLLEKFSSTADKESLAIEVVNSLKIENDQLNPSVIEPIIGRKITDGEMFKLDLLRRALEYNPKNYNHGGSGEEESCSEEE